MGKREVGADIVKGWAETAVKYGTFITAAIGFIFTLYTRFISMEHTLFSLKESVDTLNKTCVTLQQELAAEKSTTTILSMRLSVLERETQAPRLFKHEADD